MNAADRAETGRLSEAIDTILPALEAFNRFQGPDLAGRERAAWLAALDEPLPERGVGLEPVLQALAETVIPYGVRIGAPGFSGWVTVAPSTAGTAATLAATVAGAQRHFLQSFNTLERVALRWLADLLGLPGGWFGILTSGGSVANLVGLGAMACRPSLAAASMPAARSTTWSTAPRRSSASGGAPSPASPWTTSSGSTSTSFTRR